MVDLNDPETKKQLDAYLEHEKHEPIAERADDLGNREPWWIWLLAMLAGLGGLAAIAKECT